MHAKVQIRNQCVAQTTGLATTGANVFAGDVYPKGDDKLPGLNWKVGSQRRAGGQTIGRRERWELDVVCEGRAKPADGTDLEEQLGQIEAEVQAAIMTTPPSLGNRVLWIQMEDDEQKTAGTLERPVGIVRMRFVCQYMIEAGAPEVLIYA